MEKIKELDIKREKLESDFLFQNFQEGDPQRLEERIQFARNLMEEIKEICVEVRKRRDDQEKRVKRIKEEKEGILEEINQLQEKLSQCFNREKEIKDKKANVEKREREEKDSSKKREIEEERWSLEDRRREIEREALDIMMIKGKKGEKIEEKEKELSKLHDLMEEEDTYSRLEETIKTIKKAEEKEKELRDMTEKEEKSEEEELFYKGVNRYNSGDFQEACDIFQNLIEKDYKKEESSQYLEKAQIFKEAFELFEAKKYQEAKEKFSLILEKEEENWTATKKIKELEELIEKKKKEDEAFQDGLDCYHSGEISKAIRYFEEVLEINPERREAVEYIEKAKSQIAGEKEGPIREKIVTEVRKEQTEPSREEPKEEEEKEPSLEREEEKEDTSLEREKSSEEVEKSPPREAIREESSSPEVIKETTPSEAKEVSKEPTKESKEAPREVIREAPVRERVIERVSRSPEIIKEGEFMDKATIIKEVVEKESLKPEERRKIIEEELNKILKRKEELKEKKSQAYQKKLEEEKAIRVIAEKRKRLKEEEETLLEEEKKAKSPEEKKSIEERKAKIEERKKDIEREEEVWTEWLRRISEIEEQFKNVEVAYRDVAERERFMKEKIEELEDKISGKPPKEKKEEEEEEEEEGKEEVKEGEKKKREKMDLSKFKLEFILGYITIGIDISDRSIEIIHLDRKGKMVAFGRKSIPRGLVENGKIIEKEELSKEIKKTLEKARPHPIKPRRGERIRAIVSLPESKVFIRKIEISDQLSKKDLSQRVKEEGQRIIPIAPDKLYWDYLVTFFNREGREILYASAPREIVDDYIDTLGKAGIDPVSIDIETASLGRSLLPLTSKDKRGSIVVDIGSRVTNIGIFDARKMFVFSAIAPYGGEHFTESIALKMGIDREKAEKLKREVGFKEEENDEVSSVLRAESQLILREIKRAIDYYREKYKEELEEIILAGGSSLIPGLPEYFELITGKKVKTGTPLEKIKDGGRFKEKIPQVLFSNVIGLALRGLQDDPVEEGINLLPISLKKKQIGIQKQQRTSVLAISLALAIIGLIILGVVTWFLVLPAL